MFNRWENLYPNEKGIPTIQCCTHKGRVLKRERLQKEWSQLKQHRLRHHDFQSLVCLFHRLSSASHDE